LGKLKIVLTDIYNKSYNEALMSYSQRSSILSLLYKKGDHLCLDNYRPISLLNVDFKLISHVIAQRLKKVLSLNISETQPLFITHVCISVYKVFTQLMKDSLNPKCLRVFSMKFHSKESKAFVKSMKIIAPSILYISA
jgi:hypothetical protein